MDHPEYEKREERLEKGDGTLSQASSTAANMLFFTFGMTHEANFSI
jgi:hypothetical protein